MLARDAGSKESEIKAALLFQLLPQITPSLQKQLLDVHHSFSKLLTLENFGLNGAALPSVIKGFAQQRHHWWNKVDEVLHACQANNAVILPCTDENYPVLLKTLSTPPPVLFVEGCVDQLHLPQVAIIGSRKATASGIENAKSFAKGLCSTGFVVTSGMALGVDGAAHSGAMEAGSTVAVMGTGIDITYPRRHQRLRQQIVETGGAVVSQYLPGTPPKGENFPKRNQIISGLSLGVLVIEAAVRSGSLITARAALSQGREVFAIPGSIHNPVSRGCHQLIREGATLVESTEHIYQELEGLLDFKRQEMAASATVTPIPPMDESMSKVYLAMGFDPTDIDTLVEKTSMTVAEVNSALLQLELEGLVVNQFGKVSRIR